MAMEIIRYSYHSEIDKSNFLKLVSSDPILTIQILKTANASLFNYPQKITSLEKALVILGFEMVRDIVLSLSVMSLFKEQSHHKYFHEICRHSLITALSLKILAQNYDSDNKELLYLGGLLHDIGKILLLHKLGDEYFFLLEKDKQETSSLIELETKFLDYNHAELGAELADQWNLPASVVSMIRFHHIPERENLVDKQSFRNRLVYLGNLIACSLDENIESPINLEELDPDLEKILAISTKDYTQIVDKVRKEIMGQKIFLDHFQIGTS
ncbi:MAG: HDOD domain-containing protein [Calditrichia bacterium]|nr:HDOD domain-containing protein [Calditrichia bacterium]